MIQFKYSLLVPSRARPHLAKGFLESVYRTTSHKKNIEILFIADIDDLVTQGYLNILKEEYQQHFLDIRILTRERSEMLNEDYYNWAARQAIGDLYWVLADDLELVSPGWDDRVNQEITNFLVKYPDRIFCVSIKDNTPPPSHKLPKFPCFPMVTREAQKALGGWILFPKTPTWGADYISYCIFQPIERLLQIHDKNYINHISWHTKQVEVDETNMRIGEIFNRLKMIPHYNTDRAIDTEVPNIRLTLVQRIKEWNEANPRA